MADDPKELAARLKASTARQRARNRLLDPTYLSPREIAVAVRTALQRIADKKEYRASIHPNP